VTRHQSHPTAVLGMVGLFVFAASLRADVPLVEDRRPAKGRDAQLENTRPLGETFP